MKQILYLLVCLSALAWTVQGCSDDNKSENPPTPEEPAITFPTGSDTQPVFTTEGGTSTLTFTATEAWTASVGEADTRAIDWLTVSPTSGQAGTATLTITTEPNNTYDERNAAITLTSGGTRKTLTVTQKQRDALTVTSNKVELEATGEDFAIELQANVSVSYEIEESAKAWLTPTSDTRALTTTTLHFQAAANEDLQPRQGIITLNGGNGLTEDVTVYQLGSSPVLILTQDEYLVGSDGETIKVELKSNNTYQIEMPSVDWITEADTRALSTYTHYFTVAPNDTYDAREAVIRFVDEENGLKDSVNIVQVQKDAIILAKNKYEVKSEGDQLSLSVSTNVDFTVTILADWIKQVNTRGLVEKELTFTIRKNETENTRTGTILISHNQIEQKIEITQKSLIAEQHRAALIAFYNATGGDNWYNNTNWCSDKPIYEWYGVNHCYGDWERIQSDCVKSLYLYENNLIGELPEETAILMDSCHRADPWYLGLNLAGNALYGNIPNSVRNHPNWWELGWDIVSQNPYRGGSLELQDYGLKIADKDIVIKNKEEATTIYQLLAQNELTLVYNLAAEACFETIDLTEERVNMHLDYCNKGLATVYCFWDKDATIDQWMEENVPQNLPEKIYITTDFGHRQGAHYPHGHIYMYDKQGNLVYHLFRNYGSEADEAEWYDHKVDSVLHSRLGEPEDHPLFEMDNYYTSTNYSKDGEVFVLQTATKGKGIDLVFMGDAFVDKDMEPGGLYEQKMKEGMEKLFSMEPYKSLRDRFNVYSIKVVSPNNLYVAGATTAIHEEDRICFEYANKIPMLNSEQMRICVIYATPFFNSYTVTYQEDGSFIAYITDGEDISDVLIHEVGGHGIGKLKDEYVNAEYKGQTLPESEKERMDYEWENLSWGANVDWRNDPATVKWSHFLQDSRYDNEGLGLYEGAYLYEYGAYRPTENSMMRYNDSPFNAPSREQIYKRVMQMSEGSSWTYDYEDFVEFDAPSRNAATTRSLRQAPSAAQVEKWKKSHRPPVRVKGTWRDARKNNIVVPYR